MRGWLAFLVAAGIVLAAAGQYASAGSVSIQLSGTQANYTPGQALTGLAGVSYDTLIPRSAVMQAYVNGNKVSEIPLYNYIHDAGYYSYATRYFNYNLTSQGASTWFEYPAQSFSYRPMAQGTCGGAYCFNTTTGADNCQCPTVCTNYSSTQKYPCSWNIQLTDNPAPSSFVKGNDGLKLIYDAARTLYPPLSANDYTLWSDIGNTNPLVTVSMRASCAEEQYVGRTVWHDGWMRRTIAPGELTQQPGENYMHGTIERFDNESLGADRNKFNGGPGGIYRDGVYQQFGGTSGAFWNGTTGYIRIFNYNPNSVYTITYLPPNGAHVCAYTNVKIPNSSPWDKSAPITGAYCSFKQPYAQSYTQDQLDIYMPPTSCPAYVNPSECNKSSVVYGAVKTYGPVDIVFSFSSNLTAYAYTTSTDMASNYSVEGGISLASFPNLRAPTSSGPGVLDLRVANGSSILGSQQFSISACIDADGDGYCSTAEGGKDCNDTNPSANLNATEVCNGIDDNCDGKTDEGFTVAGKILGKSCNNWNGSACGGVWVCTPDGFNVTCNAVHLPGELKEICDNGLDDDCDGQLDEATETAGGELVIGCACESGKTRQCGSNVGGCKAGYQVCMNGAWSYCRDETESKLEACNGKDDDCNGAIDDIGGGDSAASTKCGCYGGALPKVESCNGMDDNCNGQADDGISCCSAGETRQCGLSNGACTPGVETCMDSQWSGVCVGGIQPGNPKVDSSCNRVPDCPSSELLTETCVCGNSTQTYGFCCGGIHSNAPCSNYNLSLWMVIAGGAMLVILAFWLVAVKVVSA